mmetsp:Transcript_15911/g.24561  ORF Transcript_15911/g.24561 Transcript_15911/m.24561 type:complete len:85 (+) Transcript_15911:427-681(+)
MDTIMPMPSRCKVYENASPCAQYELNSQHKVKSCQIREVCMAMIQQPKCTEFYPKKWDYTWTSSGANSQLAAAVAIAVVGATLF